MVSVNFSHSGNHAKIIVQAEKFAIEMFHESIGMIVGFISNLGLGVDFHIKADLKENIKSLIENDRKPWELITSGFLIEAKANVNKGLSHKLRNNLLKKFAKIVNDKGYVPSRLIP